MRGSIDVDSGAATISVKDIINKQTSLERPSVLKDHSVSLILQIRGSIDVEGDAASNTVRDIVIEPGTALAYKVWELKVNVKNGAIIPVMTAELSGGFSSMDGKACARVFTIALVM